MSSPSNAIRTDCAPEGKKYRSYVEAIGTLRGPVSMTGSGWRYQEPQELADADSAGGLPGPGPRAPPPPGARSKRPSPSVSRPWSEPASPEDERKAFTPRAAAPEASPSVRRIAIVRAGGQRE